MVTSGRNPPGRASARFGIWVGCFGWLIGFLLVGFAEVPQLWPELLGAVAVTALVALAVDRVALAGARPPLCELMFATITAIGVLLLYCALVLLPAIRGLPDLVDRLQALGPVVEVPVWLGGVLVAVGLLGFTLRRRAAAA